MSSKTLQPASETYLRLKSARGHWHNQERNPAIDDFDGERHRAMIELQELLGQVGTPADEIQRFMGPPTKTLDKPDLPIAHTLQHAHKEFNYPEDAKIWIYEWRNYHDFVYFIVSKDQQVIHSGWYNAFE